LPGACSSSSPQEPEPGLACQAVDDVEDTLAIFHLDLEGPPGWPTVSRHHPQTREWTIASHDLAPISCDCVVTVTCSRGRRRVVVGHSLLSHVLRPLRLANRPSTRPAASAAGLWAFRRRRRPACATIRLTWPTGSIAAGKSSRVDRRGSPPASRAARAVHSRSVAHVGQLDR